jgi:hypothetical protein
MDVRTWQPSDDAEIRELGYRAVILETSSRMVGGNRAVRVGGIPAHRARAGLAALRCDLPAHAELSVFAASIARFAASPSRGCAAAAILRSMRTSLSLVLFLAACASRPEGTLERFVGGVWTATGAFPNGTEYRIEREYRWAFDRRFVRVLETARFGQSLYHNELWLAVGRSRVRGWEFSTDGSLAVVESVRHSGGLLLEGHLHGGSDPGPLRLGSTLRSRDRFDATVQMQRKGPWVTQLRLNFARRPGSLALPPLENRWQRVDEPAAMSFIGIDPRTQERTRFTFHADGSVTES